MTNQPILFWLTVIVSLSVTTINLVAIVRRPSVVTTSYASILRNEFQNHDMSQRRQQRQQQQQPSEGNLRPSSPQRSRTLIGVLSMDSSGDCSYRKRHRELFRLWNDTRTCSLENLQRDPIKYQDCQLVYTFIMGAANMNDEEPDAPTMIVNPYSTSIITNRTIITTNTSRSLFHDPPHQLKKCKDGDFLDFTWLNIRYVTSSTRSSHTVSFVALGSLFGLVSMYRFQT